jgi:small conductance mechanosensitive channel
MPEIQSEIKENVKENISLLEDYSRQLMRWTLEYLPKLATALLVLFIGLWLVNRIARFAEKAMTKRELDVSLRTFLKSLIGIGLKIILIITVAGMIGIQTTSFVTILGAAGLAIGLALQGSLSNFAGGVLILIFKPYKVGDTIEVMGLRGEVKEIQIFNTILLTADNKTVILPNGAVSNGQIVNQSKEGSLRVNFDVTISEAHSVDEVRSIILKIINDDKRTLLKPLPPNIIVTKIGEGGTTLGIRFFTSETNLSQAQSDTMEKIITEFKRQGIHAPTPHSYIHIINEK